MSDWEDDDVPVPSRATETKKADLSDWSDSDDNSASLNTSGRFRAQSDHRSRGRARGFPLSRGGSRNIGSGRGLNESNRNHEVRDVRSRVDNMAISGDIRREPRGRGSAPSWGGNSFLSRTGDFRREHRPSRDFSRNESTNYKDNSGCYRCGETGHFARECQNSDDGSHQRHRDHLDNANGNSRYAPEEADVEELFTHGVPAGINFEKYKDVSVHVSGNNPPHKMETFETSGLERTIIEAVKRCGYKKPTPVQKSAIPVIMAGQDLMACAQTGSGKTAAFLLPIIHRLFQDNTPPAQPGRLPQRPSAVVVSPTRELAIQIKDEARKFASKTPYRAKVIYGGTSVRFQEEDLRSGVDILVATPGRLIDFLQGGKVSFEDVKFFVLDEADRMLDMGFMGDIEKIESAMPKVGCRQTLMFSATFPSQIQEIAQRFLSEYIHLTIGILGGACGDVIQSFIPVERKDKREKLLSILMDLENIDKTLVFVDKKKNADFLASYFSNKDFKATSVHGDRFQSQREEALRDFISGRMPILFATAVAARGLDIPRVAHVVNYDLPQTIDEYVHRIGRTGRVGNVGRSTSFYDESVDRPLAHDLVRILAGVQQEVPEWLQAEAKRSFPRSSYGRPSSNRDIRYKTNTNSTVQQVDIDQDELWD